MEQEGQAGHNQHKNRQIAQLPAQCMADQSHIPVPELKKNMVEPEEKRAQEKDGVFRRLMPLGHRLEQ